MFSEESAKKRIMEMWNRLKKTNRHKISLKRKWTSIFPSCAGIYIVFEKGKLVYVGETGNLKDRMKDLGRTVNHTLRRAVGNEKFCYIKGWEKATSKRRFNDKIEKLITGYFRKNMEVSFLAIPLGRKELEEWIIEKFKPHYNKKEGRK